MFARTIVAFVCCAFTVPAALHRVYVEDRVDVLGGKAFGQTGPYERIVAKAHFRVDPKAPSSAIITDIGKAPVNDEGQVEFSADVYVLKPRDPANGNGTLLFEVSNRGNKSLLSMFSLAAGTRHPSTPAHFGDAFLLEQGYTLVWIGWQPDLAATEHALRLYAPRATGITGVVRAELVPDAKVNTFPLAVSGHVAYEPATREGRLTVRDSTKGEAREVKGWELRGLEVHLASGFEPGKVYEFVYQGKDPWLTALGATAIRDLISFLKYGGPETLLGDQRRFLKRAIAYGQSQSGRYLRTFLYDGFNADEKGRKVFDGLWAHIAGAAHGGFNSRFAQPGRSAFMHPPIDQFPFTDTVQTDPAAQMTDALLKRAEDAKVVPKIFYTNSSTEYWNRSASLTHTTLDGKSDVAPAPDTRIYLLAGTQHSPSAWPPPSTGTPVPHNPNELRFSMRALLNAMNRWLTSGQEPPPSRYPSLKEQTLATRSDFRFPAAPGIKQPPQQRTARRLDFGPEFRTKGVIAQEPPKIGETFSVLVPQVDEDGNERAGIRSVALEAPLATYTGWNYRSAEIGSPDDMANLRGSFVPFARTKAERESRSDPRKSVEERYASREQYLEKARAAARQLSRDGFLLERDIDAVVQLAARDWHFVTASKH